MATDRNTLIALADRCEREEASRELDALILMAIRGYTPHEGNDYTKGVFAFWEKGSCVNCSRWDNPTSSLNDAATLVPKGWSAYQITHVVPGKKWACGLQGAGGKYVGACARTEALARCAAALRARAA